MVRTQRLLEAVCSAFGSHSSLSDCPPLALRPPGPLGAPGRAAGRPAHSWAGRRAPRAPRWSSWLRCRARSAGSCGRSLARPPPRSQALAFVLQLCPSPSGRRASPVPAPRRCPGKVWVPSWGLRWRLCASLSGSENSIARGSLAAASPKEGGSVLAVPDSPKAGKCAAAMLAREGGHPGPSLGLAPPLGPWPRKVTRGGSPGSFHLSPTGAG